MIHWDGCIVGKEILEEILMDGDKEKGNHSYGVNHV